MLRIDTREGVPSMTSCRAISCDDSRMDAFYFSLIPILILPLILVNAAWYIAVLVLLYKIWQKVRHLPG
jgi:hypothetical protein